MAVHSKRVTPHTLFPYVVFTNDTSLTDAVVFADGDYVDFKASLRRPARRVKFILNGAVDIQIKMNIQYKIIKAGETGPDESIDATEDTFNVNILRLFNTTGRYEFEVPDGFGINQIKIIKYTGVASAANHLVIVGY